MRLDLTTLVVPDYDQGIAFWCDVFGFRLAEDTDLGDGKRWVVVRPDGGGAGFLLARARGPRQVAAIGNQTGGRVGFFFVTDDLAADHDRLLKAGVDFREPPRHEAYGTVVVFADPWGNLYDLIQPRRGLTDPLS